MHLFRTQHSMPRVKLSLSRVGEVVNARLNRREELNDARRVLFGYQSGMPGEGQFIKPLDGKSFMRWHLPSRYMMQDFRVDQYLEMQALRFTPVQRHAVMDQLTQSLMRIIATRSHIKSFFETLDEESFYDSPSLQDLYGLYRTILPNDNPLKFDPHPEIWKSSGFSWIDAMDIPRGRAMMEALLNDFPEHLISLRRSLDSTFGDDNESRVILRESLESLCSSGADLQKTAFDFVAASVPSQINDFEVMKTRGDDLEGDPESLSIPKFRLTDEDLGVVREDKPQSKEEEGDDNVDVDEDEDKEDIILYEGIHAYYEYPPHATKEQIAEIEAAAKQGSEELDELLKGDATLAELFKRRHRFFEPVFERRRISYLDKLHREKIKESRKPFMQRFTVHPDKQKVWPDNKGITNVPEASPFN